MTEPKELFEMVTNKVEPERDAWREQEERQRARARGRRAAAFAVAAAIVVLAVVAAVAIRDEEKGTPVGPTPPPPMPSDSLVAFDVATGTSTAVLSDVAAFRPAVSPDGQRIAFERDVLGKTQIFVADIDGTNIRQLTGAKGQPGCGCGSFDPSWSPDGAQLAFSGTNVFGNRGIYLMTLASGDVRLLTHEGGGSFEATPSWSPDGSSIAYAGGSWQAEPSGSGQLYRMPVTGRRPPFLLLADRPGTIDPSWAPDGSSIVYTADVKGGTSLFTASIDLSHRSRLTDGSDDSSPSWSPDGTQVAFVRGTDVAVLTVSTGEVRVLGTGGDPAWSPDGSTIYAWHA